MPRSNHASPLTLWRKGEQLHRVYINQLVNHANAHATITGGPGINVTRTANSIAIALAQQSAITPTQNNDFIAKITGSASGAHAWTQMQPAPDGSFSVLTGGLSGTTSTNPAYEINGRSNVPNNTLVRIKTSTTNDGSNLLTFDLRTGNPGSASAMTYSGEHADAASTNTWNINNQPTTRGVNITVQTGSRYDHTQSSPKLYAYLRNLSFDANGQLVAISAQSRVIIDTPEACS